MNIIRDVLRAFVRSGQVKLVAICLAVSCTLGTAHARSQKLRVNDPAVADELKSRGARLLADYGSFQLLEADDATPGVRTAKGVEPDAESDFVQLNARHLDTRAPEVAAMRKSVVPFAGKRFYLVQFIGPVKPEWRDALEQTGVTIVHYIPQNTYLVRGNHAALAKLQAWARTADVVQWDGDYADDYKIHPKARATDDKGNPIQPATDTFAVQLLEDADDNPATLALIEQLKLAPVKRQFRALHYLNVIVRLPPARLAEIAARPEVISIQPYPERHRMDERQDQIMAGNLSGSSPSGPGYLAWLAGKGFTQAQFTASGFAVDVSDSGVDNGTTSPGHFGLYQFGDPIQLSRVTYARLEGTANSGSTLQGCDGHGNLNSHVIAGYNDRASGFPHTDSSGFHYGLGVCPFVKVGSSVIFDPDTFTSPDYADLQSRAYRDGARVSNNSWGADTAGAYDVDAQTYDALVRDAQPSGAAVPNAGNQQMVIAFAAGNAGSAAQTVGSPGTAKNVIVVGAAENVHSHSTANGGNNTAGNDGCTTPDTEANSANDIASFSSRGPCSDGRKKPDLVAPGTHVTGGVGQSVLTTNGTGTAISCFSGMGVCGLPGGGTVGNANNFFPLGQQFYTTSSGASHSTPAVAGACALLRQYFINHSLTPPSPAMTKAFLVNAARYLTGVSANDTLPSNNQGMGEVNLGMAFDGVARTLRDQLFADKFTASGQTRSFNGSIAAVSKPFRVTLAWTDAPGSTTGNAYNNNLDLTVTVGGNTYKGNVFSGANSTTGGSADAKNNVESVFLPAGVSGSFIVTVTAANINSDGVPNESPALDQDFALVIYNGTETIAPVISGDSAVITAESCTATNGAVDPGETVTMNFALRNVGLLNTTNLAATLLATNGVTSPSGAQAYGALIAGGGAVTQAFSFTATGACGSNLIATLSLTDGAADLGSVSFTIPLGQLGPIFAENFDSVTAPALPLGWTTSAGGAQSVWQTISTSSDTAPNSAFSPAPASVGSNQLVSATITLLPGRSQLAFRHRYELESSYDGGVLEIKVGTGAFTDILAAGGSFVNGGYVQTLSSGNALGARQAWTGTNASFSTVTVNLPASAAGQTVQFRWLCGTDSSVSRAGWWIDSVAVNGALCCGAAYPPVIIAQPQSQTVSQGSAAGFSVSAIGQTPLSCRWYLNSNAIANATNANYAISSAQTNDAGSYFVIVTNASGGATSSVATLTVVVAPVILTNPASLTVSTGSTAGFSVIAIGAAPLSYQWQFNGTNIPGAGASSYSKTNVQPADAGSYTAVVTNFAGAMTSAPAVLTVSSGTAAGVVISQIYGGGGNSGATYRNDYVELFNPGGAAVSLSGWSVQYASSAGTNWSVANLAGLIPPNSHYLVQLASGGAPGATLPTPDAAASINISAANGKLALVTNQTALTGSNPASNSVIADFVGYGTANAYEGTGAAPAGGNTSAILRKNDGLTDTGNNAADFAAGTPNPRNSSALGGGIDLAITKAHPGGFTQGDAADVYTITVTNVGTLATTGTVSVVDFLPAGLTATVMSGSGWTVALETLTCTRSDALAAGAAYPAISLTVSVATNAPASVTNTVTVSAGGDTNAANNTASDVTSITAAGGSGTYTGVLAGWDVSGQSAYGVSPLTPTTNAPNITIVGLTRGSGVTTKPTAAARAWGGNGFDSASAATAISAGDFATFSIMASAGCKVSFSSVNKFDYRRSGSGPTNGVFQYQIGTGDFTSVATNSYSSASNGGASLAAIDLSGIAALQNVGPGTNVTFRIVNHGASSSGGNWYVYDVANSTAPDFAISGTVAPPGSPTATAPVLSLLSLAASQFQFTLTGTAGSNYVIQVSPSLPGSNWIPVSTGAAPILFSEPATNARRFYRGAVAP